MTAPLTFGQLSTLRSLQEEPESEWPGSHIKRLWNIDDEINIDAVLQALRDLQWRHQTLRTGYDHRREPPAQQVDPEPTLPVTLCHHWGSTHTDALAALNRLAATTMPIDIGVGYGWRGEILMDGDRPRYVAIGLNHIVADRDSLDLLWLEFRRLIACEPVDELGPAAQPVELAAEQHSERWRGRREHAIAYWDRLLESVPDAATPPRSRERASGLLVSTEARDALTAAAVSSAASEQSVLIALSVLAMAALMPQPVALELMISNRFQPQWNSIVSSMNQVVPILSDVSVTSRTIREHVHGIHWKCMRAYRYGCHDVDAIDARYRVRGLHRVHDYMFNIMTIQVGLNAPEPPADSLSLIPVSGYAGPSFYLKIGVGEKLVVRLLGDVALFPEASICPILDWYRGMLVAMADDPTISVADMMARLRGMVTNV